nr:terminase family protein [Polymorphobacter sp.]
MTDDLRSPWRQFIEQSPAELAETIDRLPVEQLVALGSAPHLIAHPGQRPPDGDWTTWLILAGRGFGKTWAGAAWVDECARSVKGARIALVGATLGDARSVMVEGDAGVLAVARLRPKFEPARRLLTWKNGSTASLFGAIEPDSLRGPSFHFAWGDEAAKWVHAADALSNLRLTLRNGSSPRLLLTTTPRPLPWLKAMAGGSPGVVVTRGRTVDNRANLAPSFLDSVARDYGGTRLGRQELQGEIIDDLDGALWTRAMVEACRVGVVPRVTRTVIAVDPPATQTGDACGIVVVALGADGHGYVLADRSVEHAAPDVWARAVVAAADEFAADLIVAEVNNGGEMVASVLRQVDNSLPIKPVHAARGKVARAEPVSVLYVHGKVHHAGAFPALEDELCGLMTGGGYAGPGRSPDRADALVWAVSELLLGKSPRVPSVRSL